MRGPRRPLGERRTPELVGDAGVGVRSETSWERDVPPDPEALASGVLSVLDGLGEYRQAARERAMRFDLAPWWSATASCSAGWWACEQPARQRGQARSGTGSDSSARRSGRSSPRRWRTSSSSSSTTDRATRRQRSWRNRPVATGGYACTGRSRAGSPRPWNAGCALAQAALIARMDGDDVMLRDRLERQAASLDDHPEVALLGGGIVLIDEGAARSTASRAASTSICSGETS